MAEQKLSKKERKALKRQQANAVVNTAIEMIDGTQDVTPVQQLLALPESETAIVVAPAKPQQPKRKSVAELAEDIEMPYTITYQQWEEMYYYGVAPEQLEWIVLNFNANAKRVGELALLTLELDQDYELEVMTRQNSQAQAKGLQSEVAKLKAEVAKLEKERDERVVGFVNDIQTMKTAGGRLRIAGIVAVAYGVLMTVGFLAALVSLVK